MPRLTPAALLRVAERMLPPTTMHRPPGEPNNDN
jgi:hypothetical protein